jgi:hypothetical protein
VSRFQLSGPRCQKFKALRRPCHVCKILGAVYLHQLLTRRLLPQPPLLSLSSARLSLPPSLLQRPPAPAQLSRRSSLLSSPAAPRHLCPSLGAMLQHVEAAPSAVLDLPCRVAPNSLPGRALPAMKLAR